MLPYGVGAYQQEPRLPAILTTGPGWASQEPEEKEAVAAQAFRKLSQGIEALKLDPPLRPTLTIQTPSGLELAWMNDLNEGRKNIHGDELQPLARRSPRPRRSRWRRHRRGPSKEGRRSMATNNESPSGPGPLRSGLGRTCWRVGRCSPWPWSG